MKRMFLIYSTEMFGRKKVLKGLEYFLDQSGKCNGAYFFQTEESKIGTEICRNYERLNASIEDAVWMLTETAGIECVDKKKFNPHSKKMLQKGRSLIRFSENSDTVHSIDLLIKNGICIGGHQLLELVQNSENVKNGARLVDVFVKEICFHKVQNLLKFCTYESLIEFSEHGLDGKVKIDDTGRYIAYPLCIGKVPIIAGAEVYKYDDHGNPLKQGIISVEEYNVFNE